MRVVVDTNVFVGACIGRGASSKVIEACIAGDIFPAISLKLFLEYEDVIARNKPFARARLNAIERQALFEIFLSKCRLIEVHFRLRPNLRDEGDNHLVELALAGNAEVIVTNNVRDFRDPELRFDQIRIATPEQIAKEIGR
jgi:putative PIN family toxin of toxin-antitoxin system